LSIIALTIAARFWARLQTI
jgi:hypothetical protein